MTEAIAYSEAVALYPAEVATTVHEIRTGRSKYRMTDPASWTWYRDWCVEINGRSPFDLVSGKAARDRAAKDRLTADELAADELSRTRVHLRALNKSTPIPADFLRERILARHRLDAVERARVDGLSPSERQAEVDAALRQLLGSRGFMAFGVVKP